MPMNVVTDQDFAPRGMEAAADLLGRKAALTGKQLARLAAEHKRRAFAMAEVNNAKVIQQFREAVKRALKAGRPYREVRLEMLKILKAAGLDAPPIHRLRFLYQHHTLTSMSQAQSKFLKQDHVKRAFPYWQYKTVRSPGHRASHEAFADLVFRVDDPFWKYHDPPWEPGCKCYKVPRSQRWVDRKGIKVQNLAYVRKKLGVPPGPADWRLGAAEAKLDLSGLDADLKAALRAAGK